MFRNRYTSKNRCWLDVGSNSRKYWNQWILTFFVRESITVGREPWSSRYGKRLTFQRLWIRILVLDTGWTRHFFTLICCKKCTVCLKKTENKRKSGRGWPILKKYYCTADLPFDWFGYSCFVMSKYQHIYLFCWIQTCKIGGEIEYSLIKRVDTGHKR